ncbi:hypothetical protein [Phocaeicola vulgatus]|uniref:hypothetical protein n=1 Tax=Phocaeicola vulgatus TaxID=821 RepID=UPI001E546C6F|nr:hypothetical protein [Phocaeicola vulgatus]
MSEIMAENYNSQVRQIKQVDKLTELNREWPRRAIKGLCPYVVKKKTPFARSGRQRENVQSW